MHSEHGMSGVTDQESGTTTTAPAPAKGGTAAILLASVLSTVLALTVVAAGVYWLIHTGKLAGASGSDKQNRMGATTPLPSHVLALEPMIVNLSGSDGRSYLRAEISLRIENQPAAKGDSPKAKEADGKSSDTTAALRDATLQVLSQQTPDTLLTAEGKSQLKRRLEAAYAIADKDVHVLDVYFTDFLVQRG